MSFRARIIGAALIASSVVAVCPAAAQGSFSPYHETATAALSRYVRDLASNPKDFTTLIAAGRAALEVGDTAAAAGFYARADEVNPRSPEPQAGMGAVHVADGEPQAALPYFTRAQQLGASLATFGADRGLAYDLLGRQADAQSDYKAALMGRDRDTARTRLALSLAISGKTSEALLTLNASPDAGDPGVARARAFILALTGDSNGARMAIERVMPGAGTSLAPFLVKLPGLGAGQKAAAVNLGIFPDAGNSGYAVASLGPTMPSVAAPYSGPDYTPPAYTPPAEGPQVVEQRMQSAEAAPQVVEPMQAPGAASAAFASANRRSVTAGLRPITEIQDTPPMVKQASAPAPRSALATEAHKIWLQLASGDDRDALGGQFSRIKSRHRDLLDGIHGYITQSGSRARLLIGPFRSASDADTFASDLESVDVSAFKWSNSDSDMIVPLATN